MKRNFMIYCAVLIGLTTFLTGCGSTSAGNETESVEPEERQDIDATGIIKSYNIRDIVIDFNCNISEVNVKEGEAVQAGQSLVTLDLTDYKSQIESQKSELNVDKLQLQELKDKIDQLNSTTPDLEKLENDVKFNEDLYKKFQDELESKKTLYNAGAISKYELDEFIKKVESTKKGLDDAEYALSQARNDNTTEISTKQNHEVEMQNIKIENLNKQIDLMKNKLNKEYIQDNNIICNMSDAIVSEIGYNPGDKVTAERKILSLIDLKDIYVYGEIYEKDIKDVQVGKEVTIIPTNDKQKEYKGTVTRVSNVTTEEDGETIVPVEIAFEENMDNIIINSNVDLKIDAE